MVTSVYEDALRPFGIKGSQLNLLAAIAYAGIVRRTEIGKTLHLDISTLTRNLRVMEANGWIENVPDENDGRGSPLRITAKGSALIERVAPAWKAAQRRASRLLGTEAKAALMNLSSDLPV